MARPDRIISYRELRAHEKRERERQALIDALRRAILDPNSHEWAIAAIGLAFLAAILIAFAI